MDPVSFTPLVDFVDADIGSTYLKGLNYTIRPQAGDPLGETPLIPVEKTLLFTKVGNWMAAGKVRLGTADGTKSGDAKLTGTGTVT